DQGPILLRLRRPPGHRAARGLSAGQGEAAAARLGREPRLLLVGIQQYLLARGTFPAQNTDVLVLALMHLRVVEWLWLLVPFAGDGWRRMDERGAFLRSTGEIGVVSVALLLGGILLTLLTFVLFRVYGIEILVFDWYRDNVVVWGLLAAPLVAIYLERAGG